MIIEHIGLAPNIHPSARIAPNATVCGDVTIGAGASVGFGAVLTAESGPITVGAECVIMDTAVIRGCRHHPVVLGERVLVGPRAYLSGCRIGNDVFIATGAAVFNGAVLEDRSQVRINGVVHIKTRIPTGVYVPIGWVAVGDPVTCLPPDRHDDIWVVQQGLDFAATVFGQEPALAGKRPLMDMMQDFMPKYARSLGRHVDDKIKEEPG